MKKLALFFVIAVIFTKSCVANTNAFRPPHPPFGMIPSQSHRWSNHHSNPADVPRLEKGGNEKGEKEAGLKKKHCSELVLGTPECEEVCCKELEKILVENTPSLVNQVFTVEYLVSHCSSVTTNENSMDLFRGHVKKLSEGLQAVDPKYGCSSVYCVFEKSYYNALLKYKKAYGSAIVPMSEAELWNALRKKYKDRARNLVQRFKTGDRYERYSQYTVAEIEKIMTDGKLNPPDVGSNSFELWSFHHPNLLFKAWWNIGGKAAIAVIAIMVIVLGFVYRRITEKG